MVRKFRLRFEALEGREVPAAFSFRLPDGTIGSGQFATPAGVNPGTPFQAIEVSDLTVSFQGRTLTAADATGPVTANYSFGALAGVSGSYELVSGTFVRLDVTDGVAVAYDPGYSTHSATVAYDAADTQATFTLPDGTAAAISYTLDLSALSAASASQSFTLSDFVLNIAGHNLTAGTSGVVFAAAPTAQFASGLFQGLTFDLNTVGVSGFAYSR